MPSASLILVNLLRGDGPRAPPAADEARCRCGRSLEAGVLLLVCCGCKTSPHLCRCRRRSLEDLARTDPRLATALEQVARQEMAVLDARAASAGAEQDDVSGMALVRRRSAVASARRELVRLEESLRQCRWEALHVRMRRIRGLPSAVERSRLVQLVLFDLGMRRPDAAEATYWPETVRAA